VAADAVEVAVSIAGASASLIAELDPTGTATKVLELATSIHAQYMQMQDNQGAVSDLNAVVMIINKIVIDLSKTKQMEYCEDSLRELVACLEQCLQLMSAMMPKKSAMDKVKKFLRSGENKELIDKLSKQLRDVVELLNLALTAQTAQALKAFTRTEDQTLAKIREEKAETHQAVSEFLQKVEQINAGNMQQQGVAGRDVIGVAGGIRASGAVNVGGGNVGMAAVEQKGDGPADQEAEVVEVLKRLKAFFRDEEYEGEKSPDFERYNMALSSYQAELGYNKKQQKHTLYVNDEAFLPQDSVKAITKMLTASVAAAMSHASSAETSAVPMPILADQGASRGNLQQQGKAGRDVIGVADGIVGSNVRIGGGDVITHAYDGQRVRNNNVSKFNFTGQQVEGNIMQGENQTQHNNVRPRGNSSRGQGV